MQPCASACEKAIEFVEKPREMVGRFDVQDAICDGQTPQAVTRVWARNGAIVTWVPLTRAALLLAQQKCLSVFFHYSV